MEVTSSQFARNIGRYQDEAQREPVIVMKRERPHTVLISAEEYQKLRRRARIVQRTGDLTGAEIEAIERSKMPANLDHLNEELD